MRPFSDAEFNQMILEMTDAENRSFDTLCSIVEKSIRPWVRRWCATDKVLARERAEDDLMQDIHHRLIKTTMTHFLLRADRNGVMNRDPDEFMRWAYTVAERMKIDLAKSLRNKNNRNDVLDENSVATSFHDLDGDGADIRRQLVQAFQIVLDADASVYKILTWIAQSLFIISHDVTKIKSNEEIISAFSEKTLFEMRNILLRYAKRIEWIDISPDQLDRIDRELHKEQDGVLIGTMKYREFFMKKGGKASISDWVHRMNCMIKSRMKYGTSNN